MEGMQARPCARYLLRHFFGNPDRIVMGVTHKLIFHRSQIALWCALRLVYRPEFIDGADCPAPLTRATWPPESDSSPLHSHNSVCDVCKRLD